MYVEKSECIIIYFLQFEIYITLVLSKSNLSKIHADKRSGTFPNRKVNNGAFQLLQNFILYIKNVLHLLCWRVNFLHLG